MPLFAYQGRLGAGAGERRAEHRPKHLAYLGALGGKVRFAGPLIDADGQAAGSLILVEADDHAAASAIAQADPYVTGGVLEALEIHETKQVFPQ